MPAAGGNFLQVIRGNLAQFPSEIVGNQRQIDAEQRKRPKKSPAAGGNREKASKHLIELFQLPAAGGKKFTLYRLFGGRPRFIRKPPPYLRTKFFKGGGFLNNDWPDAINNTYFPVENNQNTENPHHIFKKKLKSKI